MHRGLLPWIAAGAVIGGLFRVDPLFVPLGLFGPVVSGAFLGARGSRSAGSRRREGSPGSSP
jgi:hypothetical protein